MAQVELIMPKMGESITEATILKWVKQVGDTIEVDDTIVEIATDKVDSEVPSPVRGVISKILFKEDDTVEVGTAIAIIETEASQEEISPSPALIEKEESVPAPSASLEVAVQSAPSVKETLSPAAISTQVEGKFFSPLVKTIAKKENISQEELLSIQGTGAKGRVTKKDILQYLENRGVSQSAPKSQSTVNVTPSASIHEPVVSNAKSISGADEIIAMDRMRRLIADHMVNSKRTSPHVTSFVEIDVTNIVNWRNKAKKTFLEKYGEKLTFTPIFIEAVVKAIRDFPMINITVDGTNIIVKKNINIGMAAALPSGNLIVPVIKNADEKSLLGLTKSVNDLANRARQNKLKPQEIQEGTFTLTNVGTFGNAMGTPIINQPQAAIMATGAIKKKPAVVETEYGDLIAVRHLMFLSLSYDHRVVDGFLGGSFLRRVGDYLEAFDVNRGMF